MSCEYLLLNGARINCQDAEGKTPLHLATELGTLMILSFCFFRGREGENIIVLQKCTLHLYTGHTAQVCLLLKHRADQHIEDESGIKPLSIAVKEANADIVTL